MVQAGGIGRRARRLLFVAALTVPALAGTAPTVAAASPARAAAATDGSVPPVITVPSRATGDEGRTLGSLPRAGLGLVLVGMVLWSRARYQRRPATA
jgi:hypothetical protein